ncbi:MAG: hypothetical protein AVDCRST_MAG67-4411, partial [uncultured Solirubrobacteraceae bacterium]
DRCRRSAPARAHRRRGQRGRRAEGFRASARRSAHRHLPRPPRSRHAADLRHQRRPPRRLGRRRLGAAARPVRPRPRRRRQPRRGRRALCRAGTGAARRDRRRRQRARGLGRPAGLRHRRRRRRRPLDRAPRQAARPSPHAGRALGTRAAPVRRRGLRRADAGPGPAAAGHRLRPTGSRARLPAVRRPGELPRGLRGTRRRPRAPHRPVARPPGRVGHALPRAQRRRLPPRRL